MKYTPQKLYFRDQAYQKLCAFVWTLYESQFERHSDLPICFLAEWRKGDCMNRASSCRVQIIDVDMSNQVAQNDLYLQHPERNQSISVMNLDKI